MNVIKVSSFTNNYIWIVYDNSNNCIIIDPGETIALLQILKKLQLVVTAILLTHNHYDHINGVHILVQNFPKAIIYGPTVLKNQSTSVSVSEGDNFFLLNKKMQVFNFPGHTKNHIGFYFNSILLFCGDTVFSAGCGKIQKGLAQQMYKSFLKIKNFPDNTLIYSGHEYTLSNINFVSSILPNNRAVSNYRDKVINLRNLGQSTIPTNLKLELQINPFFNCNNVEIKKALCCFPKKAEEEWKVFQKLRKKKDEFNNKFFI